MAVQTAVQKLQLCYGEMMNLGWILATIPLLCLG
jgi:hypothetical protein